MDISELKHLESSPFFSIGVTTFDRMELLKETLNSILDQTFSDFEIIVGNDNPSRLVNEELLRIYDFRIRFVNHPNNLGELYNMNKLLELSRGQYFTWLADDDLYGPDFLGAIYRVLSRLDYPLCVFTSFTEDFTFLNQANRMEEKGQLLTGREFLAQYLSFTIKTMGSAGIFNRKYIKQIGGMETLGSGHSPFSDSLLAIRAGLLEKVGYIDIPLVFYRDHEGSISSTSTDLKAYSSAQEDLCAKCIEIFKHEKLRESFDFNLYQLLSFWCVSCYYMVVQRSGKLHIPTLVRYLTFIGRYTKFLGNYYQCKMVIFTILKTARLILRLLKKKLMHQRFRLV